MRYLALAGPLLALGFLLFMQELEQWLGQSIVQDKVIARNRARTRARTRWRGEGIDVAPVARRVRAHRTLGRTL
jgi:hypothetical protein